MDAPPIINIQRDISDLTSVSGKSINFDPLLKYSHLIQKREMALVLKKSYKCGDHEVFFYPKASITTQGSIKEITLPDYYADSLDILTKSFKKEFAKYPNIINIESEELNKKFKHVSSVISKLNFKNATVELTQSQSLKFTLLFPENKFLVVTKALQEVDELEADHIIFSFFINRELIMSDVSKTQDLVEGFQRYLDL